jgi:hypothetical protein
MKSTLLHSLLLFRVSYDMDIQLQLIAAGSMFLYGRLKTLLSQRHWIKCFSLDIGSGIRDLKTGFGFVAQRNVNKMCKKIVLYIIVT